MGPLTTTLLQTHGDKWTHSLAINDLYFDFMGPSLAAAGIDGEANRKPVPPATGQRPPSSASVPANTRRSRWPNR